MSGFWHEPDQPDRSSDVRSLGKTGSHQLAAKPALLTLNGSRVALA